MNVLKPQDHLPLVETINLSADLGKSACKLLYSQPSLCLKPIWLTPEVAEGVDEQVVENFRGFGDPYNSAWLQFGDRYVLVGKSAANYQTSFAANKAEVMGYQILAGLGLAALESGINSGKVTIRALTPLNELRQKEVKETVTKQVEELGKNFTFCDRNFHFEIALRLYPEGTGLYLLHAKERELALAKQYTGKTIVVMMGHRNLSMLVFDRQRIDPNASITSDFLGFWGCFRSDAQTAGVREADFTPLLSALTTGNPKAISKVAGGTRDFSREVEMIKQGLKQRIESFFRDHLLDLLAGEERVNLVFGGGVAHLMRSEIIKFTDGLNLRQRLYFSDENFTELRNLADTSLDGSVDRARTMRFADAYGLALGFTKASQ